MVRKRFIDAALMVGLALALPVAEVVAFEDAEATAAPRSEDLGAELLEDDAQPADRDAAVRDVATRVQARLNKDLTRGDAAFAGQGGGAGQGGALQGQRLNRVAQRMNEAGEVLAARDVSGRASSTQQEVVSELDAMLARLQQQCEKLGGQCSKPGPSQKGSPQPSSKPGSSPSESNLASATSATAATAADRAAIGNLVKDLWGRLPERQREELLQPLSEEFLPEYAADIEEYFRVLAESPRPDGAETQP